MTAGHSKIKIDFNFSLNIPLGGCLWRFAQTPVALVAWFQRETCPKICSDYFVEVRSAHLHRKWQSKKVPEHYLLELQQ